MSAVGQSRSLNSVSTSLPKLCLDFLLGPLRARHLLIATVCKFFVFFFILGCFNESFCLVLYYNFLFTSIYTYTHTC
jgi:hypothetical protein